MKVFTLCFLLIAVPTYAQDARNSSQLQTRSDQTRNCQRYNDEDSTLVTFDCTTTEVLKAVPMPRERFNAETNSVELIDRQTGALIKSIPMEMISLNTVLASRTWTSLRTGARIL